MVTVDKALRTVGEVIINKTVGDLSSELTGCLQKPKGALAAESIMSIDWRPKID